jgi:hypothetical protein
MTGVTHDENARFAEGPSQRREWPGIGRVPVDRRACCIGGHSWHDSSCQLYQQCFHQNRPEARWLHQLERRAHRRQARSANIPTQNLRKRQNRSTAGPPGIGCAAIPSFKVADRVERIGVLVPIWMQVGIVTKVIPNKHAMRALPKTVFPFPLNAQEDGIT